MNKIHPEPYSKKEFAKRFPNEDKDIKEILSLGYDPKLIRTAIAVSPLLISCDIKEDG